MTPRSAVLLQRLSRGRPLGHTGKPAAAGVFERHDPGVRGRRQLPDLHLAGEHVDQRDDLRLRRRRHQVRILTVNPTPSGPLPTPSLNSPASGARFAVGAAVNFDWSDVTGAARYQLQVSTSSTFSTTVANQTALTASQFSTTSLPKADLFWRARAMDPAGNPGAWSAVRGFRVN